MCWSSTPARSTGRSPRKITLACRLLAALACLWMLVTVFGARWGVLAPLAVYLTSAVTMPALMWWAAGTEPAAAPGRVLRVGRRLGPLPAWSTPRWLWSDTGSRGRRYLAYVKAILVLACWPIWCWATSRAGRRGTGRVATSLRRYWPAVARLAHPVAAFAVYYLVDGALDRSQTRRGRRPTAWRARRWSAPLATGVLGGPWRWYNTSPPVVLARPAGLDCARGVGRGAARRLLVWALRRQRTGAGLAAARRLRRCWRYAAAHQPRPLSAGRDRAGVPLPDRRAPGGRCSRWAWSSLDRARGAGSAARADGATAARRAAVPRGGGPGRGGLRRWPGQLGPVRAHLARRQRRGATTSADSAAGSTTRGWSTSPTSWSRQNVMPATRRRTTHRRLFSPCWSTTPGSPTSTPIWSCSTTAGRSGRRWSGRHHLQPGPVPGVRLAAPAGQRHHPARGRDLRLLVVAADRLPRLGSRLPEWSRPVDQPITAPVERGLHSLFVRVTGAFDRVTLSGLGPGTTLCVDLIEVGQPVPRGVPL